MDFSHLNSEQKRAVETTEGPVLILAGAGAGKTKTISERIRNLIHKGIAPTSILAITFTNKAAREMRERVASLLEKDSDLNRPVSMGERPFISTFHSLGVHILREQSVHIGLRRHFAIFDKEDSKKAVREAMQTLALDTKTYDPGKIMSIISKEKGRGTNITEYNEKNDGGHFTNIVEEVWHEYEKILKRDHALDFDDLLIKTRNLLRDNIEIRKYYQKVWRYIHIDEYQDTNRVQYDISRFLIGEEHNICVVGDIDQNIYSWRGADIKNILDFEKDYPEAEVIVLEENYRSTKTILDAANTIIEKNKVRRKKNLYTSNALGEKISLYQSIDEVGEAEFIANKSNELINSGAKLEEIAVLYRANFQSRAMEEAFIRNNVPYQVIGTRFFERKEIKDIISYLRASQNEDSLSDLKRIINTPARGIGKSTIAKIFANQEDSLPSAMHKKILNFRHILEKIRVVAAEKKLSETILFIIKESGMEEDWKDGGEDGEARLENAYELVNVALRYDDLGESRIETFLSDSALQSDQDEIKEDKKAVRLLTVHAAKGLEFDTVFIAGLEDGLFPHERLNENNLSPEESEEERRLFYVALTRARKKIYLSYAQTRMVFGRRQVNLPSEFIYDIPTELVEEEIFDDIDLPRRPLLDIEF